MAAHGEVQLNSRAACSARSRTCRCGLSKGMGRRGERDRAIHHPFNRLIPRYAQRTGVVPGIGRIQVDGRLLTAKIVMADPTSDNRQSDHRGRRLFQEVQTPRPGERPLLIHGDLLTAENLSEPNATITITGREASFDRARTGTDGHEYQSRPRRQPLVDRRPRPNGCAAIEKPEPARTGLDRRRRLTIDWQRGMQFDGLTAQIRHGRGVCPSNADGCTRDERPTEDGENGRCNCSGRSAFRHRSQDDAAGRGHPMPAG